MPVNNRVAGNKRRFVDEYLLDLNQTRAFMRAFPDTAVKSARVRACELMKDPEVQEMIEAAKAQRSQRVRKTADDVVIELERLAMFDPASLTKVTKPADIDKLPEDVRRAIVGWSWDRNGNFMIEMVKAKALEMLGRHHGVFEKDNRQLGDAFAERLVKARERAGKA